MYSDIFIIIIFLMHMMMMIMMMVVVLKDTVFQHGIVFHSVSTECVHSVSTELWTKMSIDSEQETNL